MDGVKQDVRSNDNHLGRSVGALAVAADARLDHRPRGVELQRQRRTCDLVDQLHPARRVRLGIECDRAALSDEVVPRGRAKLSRAKVYNAVLHAQ